MSKKSSKRKASIKSSILLLLLIAILLIASTYAWFTANKTVTISSLNVNVEAKNGLQISTDAQNWKAVISNEDITKNAYTGNKNQIPTTMEPVSTVGTVTDGFMGMFYGTAAPGDTGSYELTAEATESEAQGATGKFIAFDIFLKADKAMQLSLTTNSKVTSAASEKGLQNASRVAFCLLGNGAADTLPATAQGWKKTGTLGDGTTYLWEPNADSHTSVAAASANSTYYGGVSTVQAGTGQVPIEYYGVNKAIVDGVPLSQVNNGKGGDAFTKVTPTASTNATMDAATQIFTVQQGITKVRVYMWVEGQDVDCDNSASGTDLTFDLQLEAPEGN